MYVFTKYRYILVIQMHLHFQTFESMGHIFSNVYEVATKIGHWEKYKIIMRSAIECTIWNKQVTCHIFIWRRSFFHIHRLFDTPGHEYFADLSESS